MCDARTGSQKCQHAGAAVTSPLFFWLLLLLELSLSSAGSDGSASACRLLWDYKSTARVKLVIFRKVKHLDVHYKTSSRKASCSQARNTIRTGNAAKQ